MRLIVSVSMHSISTRDEQGRTQFKQVKINFKPIAILVGDSNCRDIDRGILKPEAYVVKVQRYTIKQATDSIPWVSDKSKVTDIIFQVGLNDLRKGASADEIQDKTLDMQLKYNEHFPNARQHLTAIPPLEDKHIKANAALQKLASYTEANFISTKTFIDKQSGKIRANLTSGFHYNQYGVRLLAKEMKKSLYSISNKDNSRLKDMREMLKNPEHSEANEQQNVQNESNEPQVTVQSNDTQAETSPKNTETDVPQNDAETENPVNDA